MLSAVASDILSKIYKESSLIDSKDPLLNFNRKNIIQSPLILEAGDLFLEKWNQAHGPLPLDSFLPLSENFTIKQKQELKEQFLCSLKENQENFDKSDLYLLVGFLKWEGGALSPSLLIPLDVNLQTQTVHLSARPPIENVLLKQYLQSEIILPSVEKASLNDKFSILLYFSLFEKAIVSKKNWKFTRHGICLSIIDSTKIGFRKQLEKKIDESNERANAIIQSLFENSGFKTKASVFDSEEVDQIYSPLEHTTLYVTDSHTAKVMVDASNPEISAYAIQALPGTDWAKLSANLIADSIAQKKKTLVVYKRASTARKIKEAMFPSFRTFEGPEQDALLPSLKKSREGFLGYYKAVNKKIQPADALLSDILFEFAQNSTIKTKFKDSLFENLDKLTYKEYKELKTDLDEISYLYFEKKGIEAKEAFKNVKVPNLSSEDREATAKELAIATEQVHVLAPLIKLIEKTGLFPTGIYLSGLSDVIALILENFNKNTPTFEGWELRSNSWEDYQDSLKNLPEAGDKWVRYRRQTSDIYTETAVDENILSIREDFAESLKVTLKGLSDKYRNSKKKLLKVLKDPKSISSDNELLDLIDTLIELQENKRAYKDTAVLGNHLLGKDWLFERSNWFELNKKINYIYEFRETHKNDSRLDLLLQILEQIHLFKDEIPKMREYYKCVQSLKESVRKITKNLSLETPLESLCIEKWLDEIQLWNKNWDNLETHVRITALLQSIEKHEAKELHDYLQEPSQVQVEVSRAFGHFWAFAQIQQIGKEVPELFSLLPKARSKKAKEYRTSLDQFCNANFRSIHNIIKNHPDLFACISLDQSFYLEEYQDFQNAILLDADTISTIEALPLLFKIQKVILIGDPHLPPINNLNFSLSQESILNLSLRQGIPTRELWFSTNYIHSSLAEFANEKIYNHGIRELPHPSREPLKNQNLHVVEDSILETAKVAISHAQKTPGKSLGIIAFHSSTCDKIRTLIKELSKDNPYIAHFFEQSNENYFYIKTPEMAVGDFRDSILICAEYDATEKKSINQKIPVCSTIATQDLQVFMSKNDMNKKPLERPDLFWEWILYLQKILTLPPSKEHPKESALYKQAFQALQNENIQVEPCFSEGGIPVGPVIVDANNSNRFLAMVEDDCTTERFRESIEDRIYIRHTLLRQLGWKVLNLWTPFWYMAYKDEISHMITTIAIEQSVAPPPKNNENLTEEILTSSIDLGVTPYIVLHPKIEGTPHDKPILELPEASIITQLKFYVDHESPIHEDLLKQRLAELHKEVWPNSDIAQIIARALKQGIKNQKFIQTGKFLYSIKNPAVSLRDRSKRPTSERKMIYVSPEERMFIPQTMDEREIKQILGLLE